METLNRQRFKALIQNGITSHFLYLRKGTGLQNRMDTKVVVTNENHKIKEMIEQEQYDAIIVCSDHTLLQRIKSLGYKGLVIYELQGLGKNKRYARSYLQFTARDMLNRFSDALLYPKTKHLSELIEELFPHKKKFSFHNCIDTETFQYRPQAAYSNPVIGWVGRIERNKNWQGCFLITNELLKDFPNLELWLFFDDTLTTPSEKRKFEYNLKKMKLTNVVKLYKNIPHEQMPNYLSKIADSGGLLLSTSLIEGFGYSVLEALSCKCPVLTTDSDGVRSFVIHNQTGKLFTYGHTQQAVREAKELMTNQELRKRLVEQGVNYVKKHFSLKQYADNFSSMIEELKK